MKTFLKILFSLLLIAACANASDQVKWISVGNEYPVSIKVTTLSSKATGVVLKAVLPGMELTTLSGGMVGNVEESFDKLEIPGYAFTGEIGKPKIPMITAVLDVPLGAKIIIDDVSGSYTEAALAELGVNNRIVPALESVAKIPGNQAKFIMDQAAYQNDSYYPGKLARVDDISEKGGLMRGHRLVTIQIFPVQYNASAGRIRYYKEIEVSVVFKGGDQAKTQAEVAKDHSLPFEEMVKNLAVNYDAANCKAPVALPCYYDIFYGANFSAAAQKLAAWKSKQGYKVRMTNAGGWTTARLNDTVRTRVPRATYMVLISDPNAASATDRILPSVSKAGETNDQSDLYYAECDENGYIPDMFFARISVNTAAEANIVMDKMYKYEHATFGAAGTAWLRRAVLISGYDGTYQPVGVATNEYCRRILARVGYTTIDTLILGRTENQARITARLNAGRGMFIYTAHGMPTYWAITDGDDFTIAELSATTNQDMYPFVAGHCCLANDYQYTSDCFGETWPKLANKGGVTYYGSVPNTYWDEDDWLQRRYFDAIFDSVAGTPAIYLTEMGRYTQHGLNWINTNTNSGLKQYYFEALHLMNDPSMDLWTDVPHNLTVTHNSTIAPSKGPFTVSVREAGTPIQNAMVGLWCKTQTTMHVSGYTDAAGSITLNPSPTIIGDTMWVTVSKHNFTPYEGYARVAAPGAVEMSSYSAACGTEGVIVTWRTESENGCFRWRIERLSADERAYREVGSLDGHGNTSQPHDYCFTDTRDLTEGELFYRLIEVAANGRETAYGPVSVKWGKGAPKAYELGSARPNPFVSGQVTINYAIKDPGNVSLKIFNIMGQAIKTLKDGACQAGYYTVNWDGRDDYGNKASTGVYFYKLSTGDYQSTKKLTVLK